MLYIYGFILKANSRHVPCPCLHRPAGHGADLRHAAVTGPHHLRWQQRRQLGTMEPPACSPVLVATRVTETHSSSWKMAPSSHTCSFSLLRKGSQPQGSEDIDTSQAWASSVVWLQCRTWEVVAVPTSEKQVRRQSQKQLLSSLPACPAIQGHGMESGLSHQSFHMLQDASHQHLQGAPAKQPAPCSHEMCSQHPTCPHTLAPVPGVPSGHEI